jgi:hypothetical protein
MVNRRELLTAISGGVVVGGLSGCAEREQQQECDSEEDIACFNYLYRSPDDNPDVLCLVHVGGRDLPAGDIYITNVTREYPPEPPYGQTLSWAAVSDLDPTDGIAGASVLVDIGYTSTVYVLWRRNGSVEITLETIQRAEDNLSQRENLTFDNCG